MESLIYSIPISIKLQSKPFLPSLPRLSPSNFVTAVHPKPCACPPLTCVDPRRFDWIRCRYASSYSEVTPKFQQTQSGDVSKRVDLTCASRPQQAAEPVFDKQKVVSAIILLSAIFLVL
ncbi:unnamed protein product, partial [Cuscuta europaea]